MDHAPIHRRDLTAIGTIELAVAERVLSREVARVQSLAAAMRRELKRRRRQARKTAEPTG